MQIKRNIVDHLLYGLTHFPVAGIVGPRQVGKTTLANQISQNIPKKVLYLDLEKPADAVRLQNAEIFFESNEDKCIIIDEIQRQPELFPLLRSMIDKNRTNARFLILGSASPAILRNASESLAGRIIYTELTPFLINEINQDEQTKLWYRGGFPLSFLAETEEFSRVWLQSFIQTYIERDLPALGLQISPVLLRRFWTMLAHFHGNIWNASNFARSLGLNYKTVNRYMDFLEGAFLIKRLYSFYPNVKKRLVKAPKIYIRDSGLLHGLTNLSSFEALQNNVLIGASWEGFVIQQVCNLIQNKLQTYYFRTHDDAEIDLVLTDAERIIAGLEIKYTNAPGITKSMRYAINTIASENNFIITPYSDDYPIAKDIQVCSLQTFVKKYLPGLMS